MVFDKTNVTLKKPKKEKEKYFKHFSFRKTAVLSKIASHFSI